MMAMNTKVNKMHADVMDIITYNESDENTYKSNEKTCISNGSAFKSNANTYKSHGNA